MGVSDFSNMPHALMSELKSSMLFYDGYAHTAHQCERATVDLKQYSKDAGRHTQ